jgi:hypothetical protein
MHDSHKYCPFDVFALRRLIEAKTFYCEAKNFNDPLDCKPNIKIDVDLKSLESLYAKFLLRTHSMEEARDVIEQCHDGACAHCEEFGGDEESAYTFCLANSVGNYLHEEWGTKGVLSLCENWNSPPIWSHYADQYHGLCIEYNTLEVPHPNLGPVDYSSPVTLPPQFNPS